MIIVTTKHVEKAFNDIDEDWKKWDHKEFAQKLLALEKSNRIFAGGKISQQALANRAVMGIDYYISRFANEEYDIDTINRFKSNMEVTKRSLSKANSNELYLKITKRQLTFIQVALQLDVSFPTELMALYHMSLIKRNGLTFEDIIAFNRINTTATKAMR